MTECAFCTPAAGTGPWGICDRCRATLPMYCKGCRHHAMLHGKHQGSCGACACPRFLAEAKQLTLL